MPSASGILRAILPALVFAVAATAQTYTAKQITFSDPGPYTQQQLEACAGVHGGQQFKAAELNDFAQHLSDTGLFDAISATLDGRIAAVTVKFDIKPIDNAHMLPVRFENIVWLTPAEIDAAIRARFPLYIGYLPDNSPRQDDIKAALTEALAAKSITAKIAYETYEPTLRHPLREIGFHVTDPTLRVANVKLSGVTPALVPLVQKSVNATVNTRYTEAAADQTTADRVLEPLLDAGYAQAALADAAPAVVTGSDGRPAVVLTATLQPGDIYHVSAITFAGTPLLSAESFNASARLHAGDVASHAALLETLKPIDAAYRRKGYMDVVVTAAPTIDASSHQVAYTVSVEPGEPYRIHELTAEHLDPAAKADFDRGFLMKPGELYNPEYAAGFLKANSALQALAGYSAGYKAYADPNTHTVDLVITFYKR